MADKPLSAGQRLEILMDVLKGGEIEMIDRLSSNQLNEAKLFLREKALECSLLVLGERYSHDEAMAKLRKRFKTPDPSGRGEVDALCRVIQETCLLSET